MKYIVTASSLSYFTLMVEAESEQEAFQIGKETEGSYFTPLFHNGVCGDWVITDVEECEE